MISLTQTNNNGSDLEAATAVIADTQDTINKLYKMSGIVTAMAQMYADDTVTQEEMDSTISLINELFPSSETFTYVSAKYGTIEVVVDGSSANPLIINGNNIFPESPGSEPMGDIIIGENTLDLVDLAADVNNNIASQEIISNITETLVNKGKISISDALTILNQYSFDDIGNFKQLFLKWSAAGDLTLHGWIIQLQEFYNNMDSATVVNDSIEFSTEDPLTKNLFSSVIAGTVASLASAVTTILGAIHPVFLVIGMAVSMVSTIISTVKQKAEEVATNPIINDESSQDNYVTCFGQSSSYFEYLTNNHESSEQIQYGSFSFPGGYMFGWRDANALPFSAFNYEGRISLGIDWNGMWTYMINNCPDILAYTYSGQGLLNGGLTPYFGATINATQYMNKYSTGINLYKIDKTVNCYSNISNPIFLLKGALLIELTALIARNAWEAGAPTATITFSVNKTKAYPEHYNAGSADLASRCLNAIEALHRIITDNGETNDTRDFIHTWLPWIDQNFAYTHNTTLTEFNVWSAITYEYSWRYGPNASKKNAVAETLMYMNRLANFDPNLYPTGAFVYLGGFFQPDKYFMYPPSYDAATLQAAYKKILALTICITVVTVAATLVTRKALKRRVTQMATKAGQLRNTLNANSPIKRSLKSFHTEGKTWREAISDYKNYITNTYQPALDQWNADYKQYNRSMWAYTIAATCTGMNGLPTAGAVSPLFQTVTGSWIGSKLANLSTGNSQTSNEDTTDLSEVILEELVNIKTLITG